MDTDLAFDPAVPLDPDARACPAGGAFNPVTGELHFPLPPLGPPDPHAPQRSYVLTPMQDAFARHYVACGNGAEAARRAGYSHRNARYLARDNLRHPQVRWRIRDLVADRTRVQRGERVWVLTMLNHALTMATQQQLPNTMIRALSHMARLSGLEPPPRRARPQVGDPADDPADEADADVFAGPDGYPGGHPGGHPDDTLDLARTLLPDDPPGALTAAVLGDGRDIALNRHPRAGGGPGGDGQDAARAGLKPAPTGTQQKPCRGGSQTRPDDGETGAVEQEDGACGDAAGETGRDAGGAMDSRLRGNDGEGNAATSVVSRHPRESGDPGAGEQNAGRAGLKPAPTEGPPHNPCRGGSQTRPDDGETGAVEQEDDGTGNAAGVAASTFLHIPPHPTVFQMGENRDAAPTDGATGGVAYPRNGNLDDSAAGDGQPGAAAAGDAMIIAIDGAAGTGKGTLAKRLAAHLGLAHLDTGALYRGVGLSLLQAGEDPSDAESAAETARNLDVSILDSPELRSETTGAAASKVAAVPAVRDALFDFQRAFATQPPAAATGAVLDGRDVGTVICPDADAKFYLDASLDARVDRRVKELRERGLPAISSAVRQEMQDRDARDASRAIAPLKPADDAFVLDTTGLDADAVFERALVQLRELGLISG